MRLIDTHCHLYSEDFGTDRDSMLKRAENEGVSLMLMPAIDASTHEQMLSLEKSHPRCKSMMGLHPTSVKENFREELRISRKWLEKRKFIAIGETGLDFYWDLGFKNEQIDAFNTQIEWAKEFGIPVVIHSRNSVDDCIQAISKKQDGKLKGVFHCFSGDLEQAKKIIDLDFYLGIGGVLTFKNSGLDKVVSELELDRILLETDAPYLAPVPFRGKRNESSYIKYVVQKLAEIKKMTIEKIASVTTSNAERLFGLRIGE